MLKTVGMPEPAAKGQRHLRADVAEDQKGAGRVLCEQPASRRSNRRHRARQASRFSVCARPASACLEPQRQVDAGHAHHAPGGDLGVVPPEQKLLNPGEEPRGARRRASVASGPPGS